MAIYITEATFTFGTSSASICEGNSIWQSIQLRTAGVLDRAVRVTVRTVDGTATGLIKS